MLPLQPDFESNIVYGHRPCLKVIKLEYSLRLKRKRNYWLLADMCPQAANHCALSLRMNSSFYNLEALLT